MKRIHCKYRSGFSLVETIVVITIISILLAFAAPSLLSLRATGLSASGQEFGGFLSLCRSEAISKHTALRLGIVVDSPDPESINRKYAAWIWNKKSRSFIQHSEWKFLPAGTVFDDTNPAFLASSPYATSEPTAIRGDFVLESDANQFQHTNNLTGEETVQFVTFTPSGRAELPGGEERNLIFVLRLDELSGSETEENRKNWFQFNVDTLTGRTKTYRP